MYIIKKSSIYEMYTHQDGVYTDVMPHPKKRFDRQ